MPLAQVLVKNQFTGLNFIDTYFRKGPAMGPAYTQPLPFIGGQEGAGSIAAVTPKAEAAGFKVGDSVSLAYALLWREEIMDD